MLRCNHTSRIQWRRRTIKAMQQSMAKHNVEDSIINVFLCSCITDWLDTGSVDPNKYNYRYNKAILTQNLIGWHHVFMGKLSQEWLYLQSHTTYNHGNNWSNYIWGVSLVEASIKSHTELWEQRIKDAHSPEAHIYLPKERAANATRKLYTTPSSQIQRLIPLSQRS